MDFDENQFLTDVFEELVGTGTSRKPPKDPVREIDAAINNVIDEHVKVLRQVAQRHREAILGMAEEKYKNPKAIVRTRWASENYDRRR